MTSNKQLTKIFKALSDDTRLAIVSHVAREKEIACQELMKRFPLSQPTMSHHFNKLVTAKVLNNRKDGVLWFYTLNTDYLTSFGIEIEKMVLGSFSIKNGGVS
jgi:DNA-binding transcriptional ArsR family regulator